MVDRQTFEYLEGVFHDGLGTYFELLVANRLIERLSIVQESFETASAEAKMLSALAQLTGDPRRATLEQEIGNMHVAATETAALLAEALVGQTPSSVEHCAGRYAGGLAADLMLIIPGSEDIPVSLKTDKSNKLALADIGQTSNLYRWFSDLFSLTAAELEDYCLSTTGLPLTDARQDFQNIAHLVQAVLIRALDLRPASVNNLGQAVPWNEAAVRHLFRRVKFHKSGSDRAIVMVADRRTGRVRGDSYIDEVDPETLDIKRVAFTPSSPRSHYHYGSTVGVKYEGTTLFDFQVKHQRGKALTTERRQSFRDITTRLRR